MNAKANSIQIVPTLISAGRFQAVDKPVGSTLLRYEVLTEYAVPWAEPRLRLALPSRNHRSAEFWETMSYVAIWLSGLIGIGLCFLCKAGTMQ